MNIVFYLLSLFILIGTTLLYLKGARHFNITDTPNSRTSHNYVALRGAGIIFPVSVFLYAVFFEIPGPLVLIALVLISTLSMMADVTVISLKARLIGHIVAIALLYSHTGLWDIPWYFLILAYFATLAWINAYNFMDGINGITAFYSTVTLATFFWLNHEKGFISMQLIVMLFLSLLVFSFFNVRERAVAFAGDVGSVSMGFILAWFMIALMQHTHRLEYILLFSVYGVDSALTIFYRLRKGENIFEAHRTHLYQFLSNELQWSHLKVSSMYALIQAGVNVITIVLFKLEKMSLTLASVFLILQTVVYLFFRFRVRKKIEVAG